MPTVDAVGWLTRLGLTMGALGYVAGTILGLVITLRWIRRHVLIVPRQLTVRRRYRPALTDEEPRRERWAS